jgi:hypothetical protein
MRKSRVWGGYLELYAFTQLYACRLIIYEADRVLAVFVPVVAAERVGVSLQVVADGGT